jgi:predicted nucleotidyltransferase
MGEILNDRRNETKSRFYLLRKELVEAEKAASEKACVYATGSFGREEASKHSDLDLFIVGRGRKHPRELSPLAEICIKADLIEATKKFGIPEFDGDGQYLAHHSEEELIENLGTRADDADNTFTARLLLLLESKPLLGLATYQRIIDNVVAKYWRDYETHKTDFIPAFLANDILRLWRTFCVNYEAGTRTEPPREHAKRRLKNYKLKHSRLLTCYSGLLYLLALYVEKKTVGPDSAVEMVRLTPTERLESLLLNERFRKAHETIKALLAHYESFLQATDSSKDELIERFLDPVKRKQYSASESELGKLVFSAVELIGEKSSLHRVVVV